MLDNIYRYGIDGNMQIEHPLRAYRDREGLTQAALGKKLGVAATTVYRWEHKARAPRRRDLARISQVTGISIEVLAAAGVERGPG